MKLFENVLSLIYPPACNICGKEGKTYLCENCKSKLEQEKIYVPKIEIVNGIEHCYLFEYKGIIREKILQYKFGNKAYLANFFFEFFVKNEKVCGFLKKYDIIIPVPMSKKKIAKRGYNQSELIAKKIAKDINNFNILKDNAVNSQNDDVNSKNNIVNCSNSILKNNNVNINNILEKSNINISNNTLKLEKNILIKVKENKTQSTLNKIERMENVKNVYKIQNEQKIKQKKVLLFDDIYTTGATTTECIKVLKNAGAKEVGILTIAKDIN